MSRRALVHVCREVGGTPVGGATGTDRALEPAEALAARSREEARWPTS